MSKIGIVILNYNDHETTVEMINQIKDYKCLKEIVIVDNNSTDGSYDILKEYEMKNINVIKSNDNKGYSSGNNIGAKYLADKVDYIIISNPDITVSEDTIIKLSQKLDEHISIKVIAPVINELGSKKRGWKLPTYYGEIIKICNTQQRFHKRYGLYDESHYKEELSKVDVVSGCFFMIRSDILKEINYFDEGTFLYYEENILGNILKQKDYETYILNSVEVTHNLSISVDKSVKRINKYTILVKSLLYYEKKYNHRNPFSMCFLRGLYYISLGIAKVISIFKR